MDLFSFERVTTKRETRKTKVEKTFVITPVKLRSEAGEFLEISLFAMRLALIVKAKSKLEWDENKEISG